MPIEQKLNELDSDQEQSNTPEDALLDADIDPDENLVLEEGSVFPEARKTNIDVEDKDLHTMHITIGGATAGDIPNSFYENLIYVAYRPIVIVRIDEMHRVAGAHGSGILWKIYNSEAGSPGFSASRLIASLDLETTANITTTYIGSTLGRLGAELQAGDSIIADAVTNIGAASPVPAGVHLTIFYKYANQGSYNE